MRRKYANAIFYGELVLFIVIVFTLGFLVGYWSVEALEETEKPAESTHLIPEMITPSVEPVQQSALQMKVQAPEVVTVAATTPAAEPDPVIVAEPTYTEEDLELLALVIYQEAGGDACSDATRLMVGAVVMNRVEDDRFPDTIEEVLLQERQYGRLHWTGLVWPERAALPQEARAVARAYVIAERVLEGERVLPTDVIFQSEYVQGEIVAEQDGFYFCR